MLFVRVHFVWQIQGEQRPGIPLLCSSLWSTRSIHGLWRIYGLKLETPGATLILHPAAPPRLTWLPFSFISTFPPSCFRLEWHSHSSYQGSELFSVLQQQQLHHLVSIWLVRGGGCAALGLMPWLLQGSKGPITGGLRSWDLNLFPDRHKPLPTRLWCFLFVLWESEKLPTFSVLFFESGIWSGSISICVSSQGSRRFPDVSAVVFLWLIINGCLETLEHPIFKVFKILLNIPLFWDVEYPPSFLFFH